jgi:hypothetical protein
MAVVTVKSTQITNRDATPVVFANGRVDGAQVRHARGVVALANGDSIASKYIACSVPSNAVVVSVRVSAPDVGTTTATDVGLYQTTANGSAVVDADFFGSGVSLASGPYLKTEVSQESGVFTLANGEKPLWEALGLTADSAREYDVVLTLTAASDAAASVLVEVDYTI